MVYECTRNTKKKETEKYIYKNYGKNNEKEERDYI